jgi:glycosyltransferase involved in cell wall biosynthesis
MSQNKPHTILQSNKPQRKSYNVVLSDNEFTLDYQKKVRGKFNIIMFCMSSWQEWHAKGIVNRNYYILNNLLKSPYVDNILAVDFLPYTKKRALRSYFEGRFGLGGKVIKKDFTSVLRQIADNFFSYSTVDSAIFGEGKIYQKIKKITSLLDFKNVILWSYFPMFVGYFNNIAAKLKIFDTVDNWVEHPNFKNYKERLQKNYNFIDQKADIIFTVSKDLVKLFPNNKNVHWIPNGVDVEHFVGYKLQAISYKLEGILHPIIGYAGIIQNRVDLELIKYIAEKNPDKSIVLLGMVWPDANVEQIKGIKNIYLLGHKSYQELPKYIHQFDVAIIPHKINQFTRSMNPLKLYEYLTCGKPVVTTPIAGIDEFRDLVEVAETKEEFNQKMKKALAEDDLGKRERRIHAVKKYSWESRVEEMMGYISKISNI